MDTLKTDLYFTWGKDGYIRLMYIKFGPRTELTKVFPKSKEGKTLFSSTEYKYAGNNLIF